MPVSWTRTEQSCSARSPSARRSRRPEPSAPFRSCWRRSGGWSDRESGGAQRFFLSWARAWQQKTRDEEVIRLLAIDRHSPGEFRCNQIARNLDEFYGAFDVGATDELWLEPAAPDPGEGVVEALLAADLVVLGPGSLFTSILPVLLPGHLMSDVVSILGSIDFVMGECDR